MYESIDGSGFSFGEVQDTQYQNINDDLELGKLPYNPFLFDLTLRLISSPQGYENPGQLFQIHNNALNVFGRKSKRKKEQIFTSSAEVRHQFLAETISKNHFSIDATHQLKDLNSKKGTYLWIHRNSPKLLQVGDEYLLNDQLFKVNSINKMNQKIELQVEQEKTLTLNPKLFKQRIFLIGSSPKCNYVNKSLEPYHVGIDLLGLTFHNMIEDEDCSNEKGTWIKTQQAVKVEGGDLILAYPYVFRVIY